MTTRIFSSAVIACLLLIAAPERANSQARLATSTCSDDSQCDDQNACTTNKCDLSTKTCTFTPVSGCCVSDTQCDDKNVCTNDRCILSTAVRASTGSCANVPIPNCCTDVSQCDDGDLCTKDSCEPSAIGTAATSPTCQHTPIADCQTPPPPTDECAKFTDTESQDYKCCKDPLATACQSCLDQSQLFALKAEVEKLKSFYAEQGMEVSLNIDLEKCEASYTITYVKSSTTQSFPIKICSCAECPNAQTTTASLGLEAMSHIYGLPCLTLDQANKLGTVTQSGQTFTITSSAISAEDCKLIRGTFSDKVCLFSISECSCEKLATVAVSTISRSQEITRTASRETATAVAPPPAARPPARETPPTTAPPPSAPPPTPEEPTGDQPTEEPTPPPEAGTAEERKEEVTAASEEGAPVSNGPEKPEEPKETFENNEVFICETGEDVMVDVISGKIIRLDLVPCPFTSKSEAFSDVHRILTKNLKRYLKDRTSSNLLTLRVELESSIPRLAKIEKTFAGPGEGEPHAVYKVRFEKEEIVEEFEPSHPNNLIVSNIDGKLKIVDAAASLPSSLHGALAVTTTIHRKPTLIATGEGSAGGGSSCTLIKDQGSHPSSLVPWALWSTLLFLGALRLSKLKKRRLSPPC